MGMGTDTQSTSWPSGPAFALPSAVRDTLAWALDELPLRQAETGLEQLLVVDAETGEMLFSTEGDEDSAEIPAAEARRIGRGRGDASLILVHTHPRETSFSEHDLATFAGYAQWRVSVVCCPETRSSYWLGRTSVRELSDYRFDGRHFASFGGAAREVASARQATCEPTAEGDIRCCLSDRDTPRDFSDAVVDLVVRRANRYHDAGLAYEAVRDPLRLPAARRGVVLTFTDVSTQEAYVTLRDNAAEHLARLLLAAALLILLLTGGPLLPSLGLARPLLLAAAFLVVPVLPLATLPSCRAGLGRALLGFSPAWGHPRVLLRRRRAAIGK